MSRISALVASVLVLMACSSSVDRSDGPVLDCGTCSPGHVCNTGTGKCYAPKDGGPSTDAGTASDAGSSCGADNDCPHGQICASGACVPGCSPDHSCGGALECCDAVCIDTSTDSAHCGGCDAAPCEAGEQCSAGKCVGGSKTSGIVSLFEVKGSVETGFGSIPVTLLAPVVAFKKDNLPHDYNDQLNGIGCVADHFDSANDPPTPDEDAGTITISGYAGGSFQGGGSAASSITCARSGGTYACSYTNGASVATKAFGGSASPLGTGALSFVGSGGAAFGSFSLQASSTGTITTSTDLGAISYSASQDKTISYSCTDCGASMISVTLLATQNAKDNPTGASATTGLVSCLFPAGSSVTIPRGAIAAMLANDGALKSVTTTLVRVSSTFVPAHDATDQLVVGNTGRGIFGIASQ